MARSPKSQNLFGEQEINPFEEWVGMPEFVQEAQKPFAQMTVRFRNQEDLDEFARLIGQKLTRKTKSIWHPVLTRGLHSNKRWADES